MIPALMQTVQSEGGFKDVLFNQIFTFLYTIAHQLGMLVVHAIQSIFPGIEVPLNLADPIGFLVILTLFIVIVQVAKKVAWIIVIVGWILIVVRIAMVLLRLG
jgi:hypothetical protein